MTWVRLDDVFDEHPKVLALSDAAFRLHVSALCFCNRALTDGFVPGPKVARLSGTARPRVATELVSAGLWHEVDGGYEIANYLDYQKSKEKVKGEREAAAARQRKHRESQRDKTVSNGVSHTTPSHPIPVTLPEGERVTDGAVDESPVDIQSNVPHVQEIRSHLRAVMGEG